ncbi:MAG: tRNA (adenosine(37)-N6)-threonylcarbamoyltransferase complex dimerization subunit type 1 TsaB [Treponema sp.]|jgi:tRNA threonylcarbamoyladenosine biosynthesis protein TsaB|nr:tRNA (adenosine(37)-N6)-threonylcarbamoyltransferase complex dimerization subunit type 1 TsaB [Treponema sp.]
MEMNILALDTAGAVLSLALSSPEGILVAEIDSGPRHSELLMDTADSLFKSAGLKREELNLTACMKGPGSFTGLRIGYAVAKGLSLALGIQSASVPTLDCIAYHLSVWPGLVLPVIDAKKDCFFAAFYRHGTRLSDYLDAGAAVLSQKTNELRLDAKEPVILTGSGAPMLFPMLCENIQGLIVEPFSGRGRSLELLELVKKNTNLYTEDENSGPLYLRKSDAELAGT